MKSILLTTLVLCTATVCAEEQKPIPAIPPADSVLLYNPPYTFFASFEALALQPTGSNLYYAAQADPLPSTTPNWTIHEVHPDYSFGFDVAMGGIFHSTRSALTLDWEHFHSLDSNRKKLSSGDLIGPFFEIGPSEDVYKKAIGHVFFRFNEVNLDYSVMLNLGKRLELALFAGVSFLKVRQIHHLQLASLDGSVLRAIKRPSLFYGAGPQFGVDFGYKISKGFYLIGEGIVSFYAGRMKNHTDYKTASSALIPLGITPPNDQRVDVSERAQVVPGLEGKLGLSYSYLFCKHYMIKIAAGYRTQIYLNAIQSTDMASQLDMPPESETLVGVYARTFQRNLSNFALSGPYGEIAMAF